MMGLLKTVFSWVYLNDNVAQDKSLSGAVTHIVNNNALPALTALNPFNRDINRNCGRNELFPSLLYKNSGDAVYFIMCNEEGRFIAATTLVKTKYDQDNAITLSQISVSKDHRNIGCATRLLHEVKEYLNNTRPDITDFYISSFSDLGDMYIRHKIKQISSELHARVHMKDEYGQYQMVTQPSLSPT